MTKEPPPQASAAPPDPGVERVDAARWRRAMVVAIARNWPSFGPEGHLLLFGSLVTFAVALVAIGYPAWRTTAFVCVVLAGFALVVLGRLSPGCWPRWAGPERYAVGAYLVLSLLTSGNHSPVMVLALGPASHLVMTRGLRPGTIVSLAAFALAWALMALLPRSWVGPRLPEPAFVLSAILFLVPSVVMHAQHSQVVQVTLESMIRQVVQAREKAASDALARVRDLELLSAKLSHELKNPLGAAKALVQLSARAASDPETRERLEVVEGEIARMHGILHEYLTFSRPLASLHPRPVELASIVDDVLAAVEGRAEAAGVVLEREGSARANADPRRLTEALLNLVANSIEATPENGRVLVRILEQRDRVQISVQDTGRGMPPEVLERIGAPFFTTRAHGTGLGVLLARQVFTQHGGSLEFESAPGRGTVAVASLPVTAGKEEEIDGVRAACG